MDAENTDAGHAGKAVDAITGTATTGHEWDGIQELNTPLPRWWLWIFYACIVWSFGYWVVYPAWPLISTNTKGVIGYSSRAELIDDMAALAATRGAASKALATASLEDIEKDPGAAHLRAGPGQGGVRQQLRALPRPRRHRRQGLPQPQ